MLLLLLLTKTSMGQGRVVINEYMPWTLNGCGSTAEFVELLNFGPGPVDIGCYILTDGDYSVTIPPNTILQPGQFYVIAGQDVIAAPCANISQDIMADLNWNDCDCTSEPIPTSGHGFFTDGGSANEQVVLLDHNLNVIDAVVRNYPLEPSSLITTSGNTGCPEIEFDLDDLEINYETLGMSTGRGNSFARKLDGDCGWVKDPQQSADATNNTPGDVSDVTYLFSYVNAMDCSDNHGGVSVYVKKASYDDFFPMHYTLVYDSNNDGVFGFDDQYTYGIDDTAPDIYISNLPSGRYRLTVESVYGCGLKSFEFQILPCLPSLPIQIRYFRLASQGNIEWQLEESERLSMVILEKANSQGRFEILKNFPPSSSGYYHYQESPGASFTSYRLKLVNADGSFIYSPVLDTKDQGNSFVYNSIWPNPASDKITIQISSPTQIKVPYFIYNIQGTKVLQGWFQLETGINRMGLQINSIPPGIYQLQAGSTYPVSLKFVKH